MEAKFGIGAIVAVTLAVAGGVTGSWVTFETKAAAAERYEVAATDREKGDLETRLDLVKVKIKRLTDIAEVRELTEEEKIELSSLESERDIILKRLTDLG